MLRKIIKIDEDKCIGCALCTTACQQGAIKIIDKKAKLISDDFCDGFGNCLPVCPTNAITFEEREADAFDKQASIERNKTKEQPIPQNSSPCTMARAIDRTPSQDTKSSNVIMQSELGNWPVQIKLVPTEAPFYDGANLLIAADCCAFAYANFHNEFIKNKICVIGCPKLDDIDYSQKLTEILTRNDIKSITIVKMEVPCCNGLLMATKTAIKNSDKVIPWQIATITRDGNVLEN